MLHEPWLRAKELSLSKKQFKRFSPSNSGLALGSSNIPYMCVTKGATAAHTNPICSLHPPGPARQWTGTLCD